MPDEKKKTSTKKPTKKPTKAAATKRVVLDPKKSSTKKAAASKKKTAAKSEPQPPEMVAIRRKQTIPGLVTLTNGAQYHFSVQNNICLAYVAAEDVPAILAFKKNCCNNSGSSLFKEASEGEIRVYKHGGRI
jgi:hypothetical protein